MMAEKEGLAYKIYNDNNGKHIANIYYEKNTDEYSGELLEKEMCPMIFCTYTPGMGRCLYGTEPHPSSDRILNWLKDRVIPENRDMLKEILQANGLYEYDWRVLIRMNHGKCTDDDFRVEAIESD